MAKQTSRPLAMLTIFGALALSGAAAFGCGDANKAPSPDAASSTPTTSPAPQAAGTAAPSPTTSNAAPPIQAEPAPGGAASGVAPGPGGPYERASLLAYMPTECPEGRAYVDVQKMLGGSNGAVKELIERLVSTSTKDKDKAKGEAVLEALRKGGLDPAVSVREIAACVLAGRQPFVAFGIDTSKAKDATQTLFEALTAGEGQDKVSLVDEGGMKVIKNPRGELMAMVAPNVLVLAKTVDRLKESAKAPGGTAGFADAPAHVMWIRLRGREEVDVSIAEKGKDYAMTALFPPAGAVASQLATDPKGVVEIYEGEVLKRAKQIEASPLKGIAGAVKAAKWSVDGKRLKVEASAPQSVVVDAIKVVLTTPEQQLLGAFR